MTLDFSVLKTNLYNWATANVPNGMPIIYYYPNAPRPTVDYVTLLISNFSQIAFDYQTPPTDNAGDVNLVGDREFTLTIESYGNQPMQVLENLRTSLQKQTVLDSLRANGIVYVQWFPIVDITDLINSRFEQRSTMDLLFRIAQQYTDTIGTIAQVQANEIVYNVDGTEVLNQTVLIPPTI